MIAGGALGWACAAGFGASRLSWGGPWPTVSRTLTVVRAIAASSPSPIGERFGVAHWLPVAADDPESPSEAKVGWGGGRAERSPRTLPSLATRLLAFAELQASSLACLFAQSEEQELSVSPSGCPSHFLLRAPEKVTKEKGTPRPRPLRIPARRVRVNPWVFVDRPSLACHEHRRHPCRRPCGLIHELPPLPRGPVEERGLLPAIARSQSLHRVGPGPAWRGGSPRCVTRTTLE